MKKAKKSRQAEPRAPGEKLAAKAYAQELRKLHVELAKRLGTSRAPTTRSRRGSTSSSTC